MIRTILIAVFVFPIIAFSQDRNSVWVFGDSAGIDFSNLNNPIPITSAMDGRGSCASISDSAGNLIMYSAVLGYLNSDWSARVFNLQDQILQGCDSITGRGWWNEVLIIPRPASQNQYYIFSVGIDPPNDQGCYYTLVDMNINGGLGGIIQQNIQINNNGSGDLITGVKHGNGRDWWVINKYSSQVGPNHFNRFYKYLVTPDSIYSPNIQDLNDATDVDFQKIIWYTDYSGFILINALGYISEFNFDRCTGNITASQTIFPEQTSGFDRCFWFGAISPNDSLLYVISSTGILITDTLYLLQYNLFAPDIPASCDTLDSFNYPITPGDLRLAPDSKIYFSCSYGDISGFPGYPYPDSVRNIYNENLSVINQPNVLSSSCDYQPFSFYLGGKRTYLGLPNNPDYDLGAFIGSSCDSLSVNISEQNIHDAKIFVFYHADWQTAFINAINLSGKKYILTLYDLSGKEIYREEGKVNNVFTKNLNCSTISKGLYVISFSTEKEVVNKKFIIE